MHSWSVVNWVYHMKEGKLLGLESSQSCKWVNHYTSYPAPVNMTPKSWTDALGRVSENSCFRITSGECTKDHLQGRDNYLLTKSKSNSSSCKISRNKPDLLATLTMGICVVYVHAIRDAPSRANVPRKTGDVNMWSKPRVRTHLHVKNPKTGFSSGYFWK